MLVRVAFDHALAIQIPVVAAGAAMAAVGSILATRLWSRPDPTPLSGFAASLAFFSACVGIFTIALGSGLFH